MLKNLVSPKKSSTFAADFALNEKECKITVIFERLKQECSTREQECSIGKLKTCNTIFYYTVPVNKYTIEKVILS